MTLTLMIWQMQVNEKLGYISNDLITVLNNKTGPLRVRPTIIILNRLFVLLIGIVKKNW